MRASLVWCVLVVRLLGVGVAGLSATNIVTNYNFEPSNTCTIPETIFYTSSKTASDGDLYRGIIYFGSSLVIPAGATVTLATMGKIYSQLSLSSTSTLAVQRDLEFGASASITGARGTISGSYNATLHMGGDLTLTTKLFTKDLTIDGHGYTLTLNTGSGFFGTGDAAVSLTLRNMNLVMGVSDPFWLRNGGFAMNVTLDNVNVHFPATVSTVNFDASGSANGCLTIKGRVTFNGASKTFAYNSASTGNTNGSSLFIDDGATLLIGRGVTFSVAADMADRGKKIYLKGSSSALHLDDCVLAVPVTGLAYPGLRLERGAVFVSNRVVVDNEANAVAAHGISLGDGASSSNDATVKLRAGAQLVVDGFIYHNPA